MDDRLIITPVSIADAGTSEKTNEGTNMADTSTRNAFAEILYSLRQAAGLSQVEVAEEAGLDDSYISYLERGLREHPSRDIVLRLAKGVGADPEQRDWMLVAAGYSPIRVQSLLHEPKLGDLDDVLSNLSGNEAKTIHSLIDTALEHGRSALSRQAGG
jgi:transcriptional regulator with XRE-family HTH domain